jgi:hypothetical protein
VWQRGWWVSEPSTADPVVVLALQDGRPLPPVPREEVELLLGQVERWGGPPALPLAGTLRTES